MQVHTTTQRQLHTYVRDYENKALFLPEHQKLRGDVWPDKKKQEWWHKIELTYQLGKKDVNRERNPQLSGLVTTYKLADDPKGIVYLNDGANRTIHSILAYISHCKSVGKDPVEVLMGVQITEQHLIYDNKEEAIQDYIDLNSKGTVATPYEILACRFVSGLENYAIIWEPIFQRMHNIIDNSLLCLGYKGKGKREKAHKIKRDNLAMIARFVGKDKSRWSPNVTTPLIDFNNKNHTNTEEHLLRVCKELGAHKMNEALDEFERFLERNVAFYRQVQHQYGRHNQVNTLTTIRWWLVYAIYHHHNDFHPDSLVTFTHRMFEIHGGKTTMMFKRGNGETTHVNTRLQCLSTLSTVLKALNMTSEEFEMPKEVRKKNPQKLFPGYVHSHIQPFATNGNGETLVENAYENAARGARPMSDEDVEKLKKINQPVNQLQT